MDSAVNLIFFSFSKITTKVFNRSVRVKYVVCSPTKVVLNLFELLLTVWRSAHSFESNNFYEELEISNVCVLNSKSWFIFFDRQNHNITGALMHSFRVWYVQCSAKRLTLNLIEFIHLKVWRSFDSLAVKNFMKNWTTTTLPRVCKIQRISFQNCLAVTPIFLVQPTYILLKIFSYLVELSVLFTHNLWR